MTRTFNIAGGLVLAALVAYLVRAPSPPVAPSPSGAATAVAVPASGTPADATWAAIEDLAAWPAAAGR